MDNDRLVFLLAKYSDKIATPKEVEEMAFLLAKPGGDNVLEKFTQHLATGITQKSLPMDVKIAAHIRSSQSAQRIHFLKTTWFRYAAILLLLAGTATCFYLINQPKNEIVQTIPTFKTDIQPGGNKAILTLSDGSIILLDSAANGSLAQQGSTKILKTDSGSIAYQGGLPSGEIGYNTIATPKGGQYQVLLPDGTKVWLNAASSITFPVTFGKERRVTIHGESYLEVKQDKASPFLVNIAGGGTIEVLGTSFNVNAYPDELIQRTTLVEGSIQVKQTNQTVLLQPGQQTGLSADGKLKVSPARIANVLAWKNGLFNFEGLGVKELMRQVSRWYNVEVVYRGTVPDDEFLGKMERNSTLAELLARLKKVGINTLLEDGRKVIVLPSE